jgi:hypothetical protein
VPEEVVENKKPRKVSLWMIFFFFIFVKYLYGCLSFSKNY